MRVSPAHLTPVLRTLRDDPGFEFALLADLCGVDTGTTLQTVYHLWSRTTNDWLRVVAVDLPREDPRVPPSPGSGPAPSGWSARPTTCSASCSRATATCGGSMPPDYTSYPLRKDFFADDAARSPGGGVRHMEQTHVPRDAVPATALRRTKA